MQAGSTGAMEDEDVYDYYQNSYYNGTDSDYRNYSINYDDYYHICQKDNVRRFAKYFLPVFYAVTLIIGLAGNSLVVAVYTYYKKLKSKTDLYILNLAIADLLLLITLPFWTVYAIHGWILGVAMCKISSALFVMNFSAGMLFLACISVDRYLAVSKVTSSPAVGSKGKVVCVCVWAAAILLSVPDFVFTSVHGTEGRELCISVFPLHMARSAKATIQIFEILMGFAIPSLVMLYCYSAVAKAVCRAPSGKKRGALRVLLAVVGVFFLTQLPYNTVRFCRLLDLLHTLISECDSSKRMDIAIQVTETIALFHSCLNPILYAFMGASFKGYILRAVKEYSYHRRHRNTSIALECSFNSLSQSEHTSSFTI
ncbi:atypical chemokine receptor 4-like isoform X2 [Hemiscyllium ocellatum]|uniref:atypical chemokine receptor 4-like isoform X2 n=1 Tax=Hemiscyllium ocellatum TaxID=170820 RepID=UPI00296612F9|nr:atypical chemokine receptor 4-like isoform X2 [Hemiscyllium ocellatum]